MSGVTPLPKATSDGGSWTTRRLLAWMTGRFTERGIDAPRLVAEMLMAHVLDDDRMSLYAEVDRRARPGELDRLRELVHRATEHEPVQHLVGEAWFLGRPFHVDHSTLIPRSCTESLVEHVLRGCREGDPRPGPAIAEVATGSGCIAVSLALGLPGATIWATDIVEDALALARRNADRHGVTDRLRFLVGDGLAPLSAARPAPGFDVLCSNPPYVSEGEMTDLAPNVRDHEPRTALAGGLDGLALLRPIIEGAPALLAPGGLLALEIATARRNEVLALVEHAEGLHGAAVHPDEHGDDRVLTARRMP